MSQCGVNIPLADLVEAVIDDYGDAFALEIVKRLDLSKYVTIVNGEATGLTLRQSITVDEAVKADLCSILGDCISAKIESELGCERDNHVTSFYIDKDKDHLVIDMKFGERYYVSRAEIENWLDIAAGGIKSGILTITGSKQEIIVTNNDGSNVSIDVSALKDYHIEYGEIVNNDTIRLVRNDGKNIDIPAGTLVPNSPYIVSGVFVERNGGYWIDFTRSDNTQVNVDMTQIISKIIQTTFGLVMNAGYRINTQEDDYALTGDDFDGHTIVRANKDDNQNITIVKPATEDFVGKAIIVRKSNGSDGTFTTLVAGDGVTLLPPDSTPLRRNGSSATLVYIGNGVYDVFGELP